MKRGKFIVMEGIDGCGKTNQFNLLKERLKKESFKILVAEFPRYYNSVWGKLIGELLRGKYGDFIGTTPYLTVFPYMVDQYTWSRDVGRHWLDKGGWILSNRFFTSNTHQIAKFKGKSKSMFRNRMWSAGYDDLGILKPDLVIFLDVNPSIARRLNKNKKERLYLKNRKEDLAEKNFDHQKAAYNEYLYSVKKFPYWKRVRCVSKGSIYPPDVISQKVWSIIKSYFKC